jgi:ABC-2 type transport system ATP-binding protein
MTVPPAVEILDLVKHYGSTRALDGISFSAAEGEIFGLLGHNGAGKSTTIRILTGRTRPTSGSARVLGHDIPGEIEHVRGQINLVPETPTLYERATAKENLELFCDLYGVPRARAADALERVRLSDAARRKVKTFSTGMKQRLLLARALLNEPRVLFMDEPTRGLDPQAARDLHALVRELAAGGTTIVLTTHDMHEADDLCDRVAFLSEGRIAALDTPRALKLALGGTPEVEVVLDDGSDVHLRLGGNGNGGGDGDGDRMLELVRSGRIRTVHSCEPTLADVFIELAGRSLHDDGAEADE